MEQELKTLFYTALGKVAQYSDENSSKVEPFIEKCYKAWKDYAEVMSDPNSLEIVREVVKGNLVTSIAQLSLVVEDTVCQTTIKTAREVAGLITAAIIKVLTRL
jgi:DNA-binding transcriptional ArsR family regulator